jgi:hypothetical protein
MGAWQNTLLLGSTLIAMGVAGLLLRRDGRSGLVSLGIGWLGLPIVTAAAKLLHPGSPPTAAIPILLAVLAVYLVMGAGLRGDGPDETEADDVDRDSTGGDELASSTATRNWSTELLTSFQQRMMSEPGGSGGDGRLP